MVLPSSSPEKYDSGSETDPLLRLLPLLDTDLSGEEGGEDDFLSSGAFVSEAPPPILEIFRLSFGFADSSGGGALFAAPSEITDPGSDTESTSELGKGRS